MRNVSLHKVFCRHTSPLAGGGGFFARSAERQLSIQVLNIEEINSKEKMVQALYNHFDYEVSDIQSQNIKKWGQKDFKD